jgi:hypothetical protein
MGTAQTATHPVVNTNDSGTGSKGRNSNLAIWLLKGTDGILRLVNSLTSSIGCP